MIGKTTTAVRITATRATAGNAIKANDAIYVKDGVINVETSAAASKGLSCDGLVQIDGGRTTVITTGTGALDEDGADVSGCAGVKALKELRARLL